MAQSWYFGSLPFWKDWILNKFTNYRLGIISDNKKQLSEGVPGDDLIKQMIKNTNFIGAKLKQLIIYCFF